MTNPDASPPPPPPTGPRATASDLHRPRWSTLDTWPVFILALLALVPLMVSVPETDEAGATETAQLVGFGLFLALFVQQSLQILWPWVVSRWKGLGMVADWRLRFEWRHDLQLGLMLAVVCVVGSGVLTTVMSLVVGLDGDDDASNTSIISDNEGSLWLIAVIALVVIGAPLTEEVLFRGLVLRALERDLGVYVGVIGSTILFTIPHLQPDATLGESAVLLTGLAFVGLVLAIGAVRYGRLGPAIVAHFLFNAFGTVVTLLS